MTPILFNGQQVVYTDLGDCEAECWQRKKRSGDHGRSDPGFLVMMLTRGGATMRRETTIDTGQHWTQL